MARIERTEKPFYRFDVQDDTMTTWKVIDRAQGNRVVKRGFTDTYSARQFAEECIVNPPAEEEYEKLA